MADPTTAEGIATARRLLRADRGRDYDGDMDPRLALLREEYTAGRGVARVPDVVASSLTYDEVLVDPCAGALAVFPLACHRATRADVLARIAQSERWADREIDAAIAAMGHPHLPLSVLDEIAESFDPQFTRSCMHNRHATAAARAAVRRRSAAAASGVPCSAVIEG